MPDAVDRPRRSARLRDIEQHFPPELDAQAPLDAAGLRAARPGARAATPTRPRRQALYDEAGDEPAARRPRLAVAGDRRRRRRRRRSSADFGNVAVDTAGAATFTTGISDDGATVTLASDRRTDGLRPRRPPRRAARQRPRSPRSSRPAGQPGTGRPLGQRAGERVHPPRPAPLLRRLRGDRPRLRGPGLARRPLRRRADVRRAVDRPRT